MAGSIVKGDLDVSRAVKTIRANETMRTLTGTSNVTLVGTDGKIINNASTSAINVVLPAANVTPIQQGFAYYIINNGTGTISLQTNGGSSLDTIATGLSALVICLTTSTAAGTWEVIHLDRDNSGVTKTTITFTTSTWGSASGGEYTQIITAASHNSGATPEYTVYETVTDGFDKVDGIDSFVSSKSGEVGNIHLIINETPDERFAGRIVVL